LDPLRAFVKQQIHSSMNWKLILGCLLIFGGGKEFFNIYQDYHTGVTQFNPIVPALGCVSLMLLGGYLILKARQKKKI
jgi:hypothetical protein